MKLEKELVVSVIILAIFLSFFLTKLSITGNAVLEDTTFTLDNAGLKFSELNSKYGEFLDVFNINLDVDALKEFETRLDNVKTNNAEINKLENEINLFLEPLPKKISRSVTFRDSQILELKDIKNSYAMGSVEDVYFYQKNVNIIFQITTYEVESYSGSISKYTIIKKTIKPITLLENVAVYEVLPIDINLVILPNKGNTIEGNSVKYEYSGIDSNGIEIKYGIKKEVDNEQAYEFKTIIVPKYASDASNSGSYSCGDGTCLAPYEDEILCPEDCIGKIDTGLPWLYIIIILVILVLCVFYFNYYKGRADFRRLTKGKSPFASNVDMENVRDFIRKSSEKGNKPNEISKALQDKGWNKKQIKYAFEDVRWEMKKALLNITPKVNANDTRVAEEYIKKCLAASIDDLKIKNALVSKGWKKEQIESAFKKAK